MQTPKPTFQNVLDAMENNAAESAVADMIDKFPTLALERAVSMFSITSPWQHVLNTFYCAGR